MSPFRSRLKSSWPPGRRARGTLAETAASVPVVVDFWAAWCGPCRMIAPVLQDLATRQAGKLKVVKVDVPLAPDDVEAQTRAADFLLGTGDVEGAFDRLLDVVRRRGSRGRPPERRGTSPGSS